MALMDAFGPQPTGKSPTPVANPVGPPIDSQYEQFRRHMNVMHEAMVKRLKELRDNLQQCNGNIVCWRHKSGFDLAFRPNIYLILGVASSLSDDANDWDLNLYGVHLCIQEPELAKYIGISL